MAIRNERSGVRTATTTTDTYTFPNAITGKLLKVHIVNSASTDYKVYTLAEDGSSVDEYILGATSSTVTVTANSSFYPGRNMTGVDGSTATTSAIPLVLSNNKIKVDVTNIANADTWSIELTYEV